MVKDDKILANKEYRHSMNVGSTAQHLWSHIDDVVSGATALWLIGAVAQTMPTPEPMERWYGWGYNFIQLVAANWKLVGRKG